MSDSVTSLLGQAQRAMCVIEKYMLTAMFFTMLMLALVQIILRNFFEFGLVWSETLTRLLVFWTVMVGAMAGVSGHRHLRIDLVQRYAPKVLKGVTAAIVDLVSAGLCMLLSLQGARFLVLEYQDPSYSFANLPNWPFIAIMPIAFMIMGLRYFADVAQRIVTRGELVA